MEANNRHEWGSRLAAILVTTGSAIGLGNIWKFPYMAGTMGGGGFVLLYVGCVLAVGLPILVGELYIGQRGRANAAHAFEKIVGKKTAWSTPGYTGIVAAFLILSFYTLIGGWVLNFIGLAATNAFSGIAEPEAKKFMGDLMGSPQRQILCQLGFLAILLSVVLQHLQKGIERWSRMMMPFFGLVVVVLVVRSMFLPGFSQALEFLFVPHFEKITPAVTLSALGLSFFKLSLGMGTMITYGSYLSKKENPIRVAASVAISDTLVALVVGTMIFSVTFTYGLSPMGGPGLTFEALPLLLGRMPGGYLFGLAFFSFMAFVALTASMSIIEVPITFATEAFNTTRPKAAIISTVLIAAGGLLCVLVPGTFDWFDYISSNIILPLGGIIISVFMGWYLGSESIGALVKSPVARAWLLVSTRVVAPLVVAVVMIKSLFF